MVEPCNGEPKEFLKLTDHELLNLKPSTVLEIPTKLNVQYSISPSFLQAALKPYLVQSTGKDVLERHYGIKPGKYMISATKHYSWPKGGGEFFMNFRQSKCLPVRILTNAIDIPKAISGIGSDNFVDVDVDDEARMNTSALRNEIDKCIEENIPIFGVVAIMGSTEHGACDPLAEIVKIREEYQKEKGISFAIHCDAAWGGYFASLLRERVGRGPGDIPYVPAMPLNPHTRTQLESLGHADSITIDPHK